MRAVQKTQSQLWSFAKTPNFLFGFPVPWQLYTYQPWWLSEWVDSLNWRRRKKQLQTIQDMKGWSKLWSRLSIWKSQDFLQTYQTFSLTTVHWFLVSIVKTGQDFRLTLFRTKINNQPLSTEDKIWWQWRWLRLWQEFAYDNGHYFPCPILCTWDLT